MVLRGQPPGRVGRRRIISRKGRRWAAFSFSRMAGMELRSDGIILRPWRDDDLEALTAACQDSEIARWLPVIPSPYSEDDGRAYLEQTRLNWELGDVYNFAVVDESDRLLGSIAIRI